VKHLKTQNLYDLKLQTFKSIAQGITALFNPWLEAVIHDASTDKILDIYNCFSNRKVGDKSYVSIAEDDKDKEFVGPYFKENFNGKSLKSVTFIARDKCKNPILYLCLNFDTSFTSQINNLLKTFNINSVLENTPTLGEIFEENIYEKINSFVSNWCSKNSYNINNLTKSQKAKLINDMQTNGGFKQKNAAEYTARILNISRATVYNYLRDY
jgi:predicted transcriptional regulator YheO